MIIEINGSHGTITANRLTGEILTCDNDEYKFISRIDTATLWDDTEFDILSVGYWTTDGSYEAPEDTHRD